MTSSSRARGRSSKKCHVKSLNHICSTLRVPSARDEANKYGHEQVYTGEPLCTGDCRVRGREEWAKYIARCVVQWQGFYIPGGGKLSSYVDAWFQLHTGVTR